MNEETVYKKVGRKYVPIAKYTEEWNKAVIDSFPVGKTTLVINDDHSTMRRYGIDPAIAPFVAAAILMEHDLAQLFVKAAEPKLEDQNNTIKYTKEQEEAWNRMCDVLSFTSIRLPSHAQVAERILDVIKNRAIELMKDADVQEQYEQFLTLVRLKNG